MDSLVNIGKEHPATLPPIERGFVM